MTITSDENYLHIGTKSVVKANILFFDRDETNVYVVMGGRKLSHYEDGNGITLPFAEVEVAGEDPFESAEALQTFLLTF